MLVQPQSMKVDGTKIEINPNFKKREIYILLINKRRNITHQLIKKQKTLTDNNKRLHCITLMRYHDLPNSQTCGKTIIIYQYIFNQLKIENRLRACESSFSFYLSLFLISFVSFIIKVIQDIINSLQVIKIQFLGIKCSFQGNLSCK